MESPISFDTSMHEVKFNAHGMPIQSAAAKEEEERAFPLLLLPNAMNN
jgi:hypothetical protein